MKFKICCSWMQKLKMKFDDKANLIVCKSIFCLMQHPNRGPFLKGKEDFVCSRWIELHKNLLFFEKLLSTFSQHLNFVILYPVCYCLLMLDSASIYSLRVALWMQVGCICSWKVFYKDNIFFMFIVNFLFSMPIVHDNIEMCMYSFFFFFFFYNLG